MTTVAIRSTVNSNIHQQYIKNLTFQNLEHYCKANTWGVLFSFSADRFENVVVTGDILCGSEVTNEYVIVRMASGQNVRHRVDRFGCNLHITAPCPVYLSSHSDSSEPSTSSFYTMPLYDSRITLDLEYNGTKSPFFHNMYNCKISGRIKNNNTSATELAMNPSATAYSSAVSVNARTASNGMSYTSFESRYRTSAESNTSALNRLRLPLTIVIR